MLASIAQPINAQSTNVQMLQWNAGSNFLTVIDNTTGQSAAQARKLNFYANANGYLSGVDSSLPFSNAPCTHTALTFDGGGHMTALQVYAGNGQTPVHQDLYAYGGPNGDSVTGTQQGVSVASYVFTADPLSTDATGLPIPRLTSALYGNSADARSSDDGNTVQGIFQYTYGPMQAGFGASGAAAHTNTITDPLGNVSLLQYGLTGGVLGLLNSVTVTGPDYVGTPVGSNISNIYYEPDVLNPTAIQFYDPLNNLGLRPNPWTSTFDQFGNLLTTVDPLFNTWTLVYDESGQNLLSAQDPTGQMIQFNYGENNNPGTFLTSVQDATGLTRMQMNYNAYGQPLTQTVPANASGSGQNEITTLNYDPVTGDVTGIVDALGNQATINSYDPLSMSLFPDTGNPANSLTPLTSTVVWDAAQQLALAGLPNGVNIQSFRTNSILTDLQVRAPVAAGGSLLSQIHYDYDSRGRVYNVADLMGTVEQYRFDKDSHLTRILDAAGNTTQLNYGHNSELTSMIWPDQQHTKYVYYDAGGRVQSTVDENFQLIQYQYDAADRVTDVIRPANPSQNIHITYDAASRPLTISDGTGQRQYTYDPVLFRLTRVRTILNALPAGNNTFDVIYGYYPDGSVASMTSPAGTTFYFYDASGELSSLVDPFGNTTTWSRDHIGRTLQQKTQTSAGATIGTAYTYGNSNQPGDTSNAPLFLSGITQTVNNQVSYSYSLEHDYLGNLLAVQGTGTSPGQQRSSAFTYDLRGRMTSAVESFSPNNQTTYTSTGNYSYDLCNNLMGGGGGWSYNANNQLTSAPAAGGLPGATGLQYDGAGNLVGIDGHTLSYDSQNQLAAVDNSVSYTHDASGHMVSRTSGGQTTYFLYSGDSLIAEVDGTGTVTQAYTWGNEGLISTQNGNVPTFARFDPLGNLSGLLNGLGSVVQEMAYKAYGGSLGAPAANTAFGWQGLSGAYTDGNFPGLVFAGSRPYLSDVGRYASPSAAGSGGTTPYTYAGGNPANYSAPGEGDADDDGCNYGSWGALYGDYGPKGAQQLTAMPAYQPGSDDRRKLSAMAGALPYGVGELYMGYMVVTGKDSIAGTCLSPGERLFMAACLAVPFVGSKIAEELGGMCRFNGGCFVAGTPVQVATLEEASAQLAKNDTSGKKGKKGKSSENLHTVTKPIEQVREGDLVASRNPVSGKTELRRVVSTSRHTVMKLIVLSLADAKTGKVVQTLTTTAEHPFAVKGKGFVVAGQLAIGNAIVTRAGPALVVKSKQVQAQPKGVQVYNFSVDGDQTYFVGTANGGIWVHNAKLCPFDILFTQDSIGSTFTHGPWAGRTLQEAIDETRRLGRLPDGLTIDVANVGYDKVTLNNRTLYVAQQANLRRIPINDLGNSGWNAAWKLMKEMGGPLPHGTQPIVRAK